MFVLRSDGSTSRPSGGECDKFLPWLLRKTDMYSWRAWHH
ncbi:hypothetical protein A2U01_0051222, partial [Trifolium medium]|nr:hypothetical protein [Trifolium medium]